MINVKLDDAARLVWEAIQLIDKTTYPTLRRDLENSFDALDNQIDYEDEASQFQDQLI